MMPEAFVWKVESETRETMTLTLCAESELSIRRIWRRG